MDPTLVVASVVLVGALFLVGLLLGLQITGPRRRRVARRLFASDRGRRTTDPPPE